MKVLFKSKFRALVLPVVLIGALLSAACGTAAPEDLTIPVKLQGGELDVTPIQVSQNDNVTLQIETDQPGSFHLHGYDIEKEVKPGEVTEFVFVADATGRFRMEFHIPADGEGGHSESGHNGSGHDVAGHGEEFQSEVLHPGDTFETEIAHHMEPKTIPYHSHLHPEIHGEVTVSGDAPEVDTVQVELQDGATVPSEVVVRPGTTIVWTNNTTEMQTVHSGEHTVGHNGDGGGSEDSHDHDHGEGEAVDSGFLEVAPG